MPAARYCRPRCDRTARPIVRAPARVPVLPAREAVPSASCSAFFRRASCRESEYANLPWSSRWPWPRRFRPRPSPCALCPASMCSPRRPMRLATALRWPPADPRPRRRSPKHHVRASRIYRSKQPHILDRPGRYQPDIQVCQSDRKQTQPRKHHMSLAPGGDPPPRFVTRLAKRRARKAVQLPACQVPQGMARQRVGGKQANIHKKHQCAHADSKLSVKKERLNRVLPMKKQEIPVQVLHDERKLRLAAVRMPALTYRATRWIEKKCPVVCFPVVVAGSAKAERPAKNQQRWRELPPMVMGIDQRRVERGQIRSPFIEFSFKRSQSRVNAKSSEYHHHRKNLHPTRVTPQRGAKLTTLRCSRPTVSHQVPLSEA